MCNFRSGSNGQAQRFVHLEVELEAQLGKPVITHDNALYWRIFKSLGLAPVTEQGSLLSSLKD
jgi:maleate cis-trans isomerase